MSALLHSLKFNLAGAPIRRQTMHGKQYVVAPMAMLTEGVHAGSGGPLLYRENECKKAAMAWNMKPIVVYHPQINGAGVSACDPDILEKQQVGVVMNCTWNGKLRADAWIEEDRANMVDDRVVDALDNNKMMEVSTGLFTTNSGDAGEWNGEEYNAEAVNHQPDHLALLPDQIGACSIADGAGLLQMNEAAEAAGCDVTRLMARQMDEMRRMVGNAMSHSNIREALATALRAKLGVDEAWVVDVYDNFLIYEVGIGGKIHRLDYTTADAGIELADKAQEVVRVTEYRVAESGDFVGNVARKQTTKNKELHAMKKAEIINALIANVATTWAEGDRAALDAIEEDTLIKMNTDVTPAPVDAPVEDPVVNAAADGAAGIAEPAPVAPVTTEAYIENAPPEIREVLTNALATQETQKTELIAAITANAACSFTPEFLATKGIAELQGLATLAAQPVAPAAPVAPTPMFNGQATPAAAPTANAEEDAGLALPAMDFATA